MKSRVLLIASLSASALILANALPLPFDLMGSTAAHAKDGGNGNGGGNGGGVMAIAATTPASLGGSSGNSGNHGGGASGGKKHVLTGIASNGHGKLKATGGGATGKAHVKTDDSLIAEVDPTEKEKSLDARLGALHAVNANLQAFIHASPNSRVGKLAAYAQALAAEEDAKNALDPTIQSLLTENPPPTDADLRLLEDGSNTLDIETFIAARASADDLLAAAANKPVDADVKNYVDDKLTENGILDYYQSLPQTTSTDTASQ